jgi:HlyD family secretion protein
MDIVREGYAEQKKKKQIVWISAAGLGVVLLTVALARLKPAAPSVDRGAVWIDAVKRGPMLRQVRGPGTLVPEEFLWIAASTDGQVQRVVLRPGALVQPDSVILELISPEVSQAALEAESQLRAAEADYQNLEAQLASQALNQESQAAAVEADAEEARLRAEADAELGKEGLVSSLTQRLSTLRADQLKKRSDLEGQRVRRGEEAMRAQLAAQRARVDQLRTLWELRRGQAEGLHVRAGLAGVLQEVPVEAGQRVAPGSNLAKVAQPEKLKAELRIAETQAKDVTIGLEAEVDTRNGIVKGRVVRVDPAVREGTVTVDVALEGALPPGARPDLSVDGTIELERLADVLFVGRPAFGQPGSTVGLFRMEPDGKHAVRVPVKLGRASVNTVEIVEGLFEGDQVVLSDMSAWDAVDRVRLKK